MKTARFARSASKNNRSQSGSLVGSRPRRLRIEPLEERRLLSVGLAEVGTACEIHGQKWHDLNGNGTRDPGDIGLDGWTIELADPTDGTVVDTTVTASGWPFSTSPIIAKTAAVAIRCGCSAHACVAVSGMDETAITARSSKLSSEQLQLANILGRAARHNASLEHSRPTEATGHNMRAATFPASCTVGIRRRVSRYRRRLA